MSTYLEQRRAQKLGIKAPEPKKPKKPLRRKAPLPRPTKAPAKRSEKMKGIMMVLKAIYAKILKKRPVCEIKSPVCTRIATCIHHKAGRAPSVIIDQEYMAAACSSCNLYVEENDKWARENGHKVSRHAKVNKCPGRTRI